MSPLQYSFSVLSGYSCNYSSHNDFSDWYIYIRKTQNKQFTLALSLFVNESLKWVVASKEIIHCRSTRVPRLWPKKLKINFVCCFCALHFVLRWSLVTGSFWHHSMFHNHFCVCCKKDVSLKKNPGYMKLQQIRNG